MLDSEASLSSLDSSTTCEARAIIQLRSFRASPPRPPAKHTHFNVSSGKTISPRRRKISLFPAPCPLHLPPRTGDGIYPPQSRIATLELEKPSGYSENLPNLSQICYRRPSKERHHGSYVTLQHKFPRIDSPPQFPHEISYRLKKLWVCGSGGPGLDASRARESHFYSFRCAACRRGDA